MFVLVFLSISRQIPGHYPPICRTTASFKRVVFRLTKQGYNTKKVRSSSSVFTEACAEGVVRARCVCVCVCVCARACVCVRAWPNSGANSCNHYLLFCRFNNRTVHTLKTWSTRTGVFCCFCDMATVWYAMNIMSGVARCFDSWGE
jgi:hypothetical protein